MGDGGSGQMVSGAVQIGVGLQKERGTREAVRRMRVEGYEAGRLRRAEARKLEGAQASAFEAAGVDISTGTALDVQATTAAEERLIALKIEENILETARQIRFGATIERGAAVVGGSANIVSGVTTGATTSILACWVAAEFYGWHTPAWWSARNWIMHGWEGRIADLFRRVYLVHGPRMAGWVRRYRVVRAILRPLFEWARKRGSA